jgi:hypothetical protein
VSVNAGEHIKPQVIFPHARASSEGIAIHIVNPRRSYRGLQLPVPEKPTSDPKIERSRQARLNDLKYDLMVVNQNLGTVVPGSQLAEDLLAKSSTIQQEITKLENEELASKLQLKRKIAEDQTKVKKVQDEDGRVRIWSSSS